MSIMRYVDEGRCCFFPGKVLDEIDRVCRSVQPTSDIPLRPYELLHELRDISSMAVEHFEDILLPVIQRKATSAAIYDGTWNSIPSTSTSLPSLVPNRTAPTPTEDLLAAALCRARQRYSLGASVVPSPHNSDLEERVKRLEQAQTLNRSRLGMSLRAISQLFIRLREMTEQNKRLEGLVTAQSHKIQQLEALWSRATPFAGNADAPSAAPPTNIETAESRKRPHASTRVDLPVHRKLRSQTLSGPVKRSRKN